eukprot:8750162-Pyramimonas_sp.AAC.1
MHRTSSDVRAANHTDYGPSRMPARTARGPRAFGAPLRAMLAAHVPTGVTRGMTREGSPLHLRVDLVKYINIARAAERKARS